MRRFSLAVVGALIALGLTLPAEAQEPKRKRTAAASQPPPSNWNGLQTGANGGNSSLAQNFADPGAFLCPVYYATGCAETDFRFSGHPSSLTAGAFTGYRVQIGQMVVGIEGDLAWKKATSSLVQTGVTPLYVNETFTGSMTQGWDGSLRARLGVLLAPSLLAYATVGLAFGEVSGSFSYSAEYCGKTTAAAAPAQGGYSCPCTTVKGAKSWSDVQFGHTLGGGLEADVGFGLKARFEYRYTDLGHISKNVPLTSTGCEGYLCGTNARIDMNAAFHTVRLGLGIDL